VSAQPSQHSPFLTDPAAASIAGRRSASRRRTTGIVRKIATGPLLADDKQRIRAAVAACPDLDEVLAAERAS
jgi:hypothetical protein